MFPKSQDLRNRGYLLCKAWPVRPRISRSVVLSQIEILDSPSAEPLRYEELLEGNEFLLNAILSLRCMVAR